jgi:hypothetical protein
VLFLLHLVTVTTVLSFLGLSVHRFLVPMQRKQIVSNKMRARNNSSIPSLKISNHLSSGWSQQKSVLSNWTWNMTTSKKRRLLNSTKGYIVGMVLGHISKCIHIRPKFLYLIFFRSTERMLCDLCFYIIFVGRMLVRKQLLETKPIVEKRKWTRINTRYHPFQAHAQL